jgi:hypothetical protein
MQTPANKTGGTTTVFNHTDSSVYNFPFEDKIYIGKDVISKSPSMWNAPKGIDTFAWYTAHEAKHRAQMAELWPNLLYVQSVDLDTGGPNNRSGDDIPDSVETTYIPGRVYDPTKYATHPDELGYGQNPLPDREDINIRSKGQPTQIDLSLWSNGDSDSSDWANPGKNSKDDTFR